MCLCLLVDGMDGLSTNAVLCILGCHLVVQQKVIYHVGPRLGLSVLPLFMKHLE